jgi:hypothetical protein
MLKVLIDKVRPKGSNQKNRTTFKIKVKLEVTGCPTAEKMLKSADAS